MRKVKALKWCCALIIIFILAACTPPVGAISGDSQDGAIHVRVLDDFWVVPRRLVYFEGDSFVREDDLWVFASHRGVVERIDVRQVRIDLIRNPNNTSSPIIVPIPANNGNFRLTSANIGTGRKLVSVSYQDIVAEYSIEIHDITGNDNGGGGGNDDNGNIGGIIIWE